MGTIQMILTGTFFLIIAFLLLANYKAARELLVGLTNAYLAGVHELQTGNYTAVQ